MATDIVQSLFGVTPDMYQRQQDALAEERAIKFAGMDPMAQATYGIYRGAGQLGGALGRALGGEDPELARISLRQQVARSIDPTSLESIQAGIQRLAPQDPQGAMMLAQEYRRMLESTATVRQREAAAQASEAAAKRERQPPADILKAQEIARLKQQRNFLSMDTRDETGQRDQQLELLDAQIAALEQRKPIVVGNALVTEAGKVIYTGEPKLPSVGDAREAVSLERFDKPFAQLDQTQRAQVNTVVNSEAIARAQAGAAVSPIAVVGPSGAPMFVSRTQAMGMTPAAEARQFLPPSLQKDESKDLELVDSLTMRKESLKEPLTLLTPDPTTKKSPLELGPVKNLSYIAQNAAGKSTTESRAYAALQRAVQEATNLKTDAAKGVQTDKDVLRFANELIAAFGKNDTQTTFEALTNFNKATQSALDKTRARIDARRVGQGVAPFYGGASPQRGTPQDPIKLD